MNLLIKNVRIENAPQLTDIRIKDGKFAQLEAGLEAQGGGGARAAGGGAGPPRETAPRRKKNPPP